MSAGIDLTNEFTWAPSIVALNGVGSSPASGEIVGAIGDLRDANMLTHLIVQHGGNANVFRVQVQTSADSTSGTFTDPTSGLQRMPTNLLSGGILLCSSGSAVTSGGVLMGGFLRPENHRYARARVLSGDAHATPVNVAVGAWSKRTGSGAGYTFSPSSGVVGGF